MATDPPKDAPEQTPEKASVQMPEKPPENAMKSPREKPGEVRPVTVASSQYWVCPWCGRSNGIPEVTTCACGARLTDGGVEKA